MLAINQLKTSINSADDIKVSIAKKLKVNVEDILEYKIIKRSLDARKKQDIYFVYRVAVSVHNESSIISKKITNVESYVEAVNTDNEEKAIYDKSKKIAI